MSIVRNITADVSDPQPFTVRGDFIIYGAGSFGGGTAQLERENEAGGYESIVGAAYTAAFNDEITSASLQKYRIIMSGSTTPTLRIEISGADNFNS